MEERSIASKAKTVGALFGFLLDLKTDGHQAEGDTTTAVENQYGRFNIWAGNIGVFAAGHASLDHRLCESPKAEDFMKELLEELQRLLRRAAQDAGASNDDGQWQTLRSSLEDDVHDASRSISSFYVSSASSSNIESTIESVLTPSQERARGIEEIIDHLYRLSIIIRKASTYSQNAKATTFRIVDDDGNDCDAEFVNFASRLVDHWFPNADEALRGRLSRCVVLRRKRLLYRQRHQLKLSYGGSSNQTQKSGLGVETDTSTIVRVHPNDTSRITMARRAGSTVPLSGTSATSFARSRFDPHTINTTHSVISRTVAASSDRVTFEPIPPPPKVPSGSKEVECPYCCLMIPVKDTKLSEWRRHFFRDLEPFVCVYGDCAEAERMFSDRRTWLAHMQERHTRQWCCIAPGHDLQSFNSDEDFEQHMMTAHEGAFDESHLPFLKKRAERPGFAFSSCPLCGYNPTQHSEEANNPIPPSVPSKLQAQTISNEVAKHVAAHLQSLAMRSLPSWGKLEDETLQSEVTVPTISEAETSHKDELSSLTFKSNEDSSGLDQTAEGKANSDFHRSYSLGDMSIPPAEETSALDEWSFIEQTSYVGHDRDPTLQSFLRKVYIENSPYMSDCSEPNLPCHVVPFARNDTFFGRKEALAEAERVLCPSHTQDDLSTDKALLTYPRCHAIYGPGGMGKTQVACEFVYRHLDHFDAIFWVHADYRPSMFHDFNEIALKLGLVAKDSSDARDYTYTRELVKRWLVDPRKDLKDEKSERASWLLIYDAVTESKTLNEFWPYDGPGSILITSRSPFSWVVSWPLAPFNVDDATDFLLSLTGRYNDSVSREEVARVNHKLGGLPLALTQMAGVMKQRHLTFAEFIEAYNQRERRQEMLSVTPDESLRPSWYEHNLASVWGLEHLSLNAATLLNTFSMFDPDGISDRLYTDTIGHVQFSGLPAFPQSLAEYRDARIELLNSSLITGNRLNRKFFVHRIIQDVVRIQLSKRGFRDTFMACMQLVSFLWPFEKFPSWRHGVGRWSVCEELFPHILRLKDLCERDAPVPSDDDFDGDYNFARLLTDAGWYRHERGRSEESNHFNDMAQQICEVWKGRLCSYQDASDERTERLQSLDSTIAEIVHNKGCIASEVNEPDTAFDNFKQFNSMMVQAFTKEPSLKQVDMRLAISWNELGNAYMLKKQWAKGQECFQHSTDMMKHLDNFQLTDLSLPLVNIGLAYWLQGEYSKALAVLNRGLADRERCLGADDRTSFTKGRYLHALGNVKNSLGAHEESLAYHRKALQHYKSTLGSNHHRTADLYVKVAEHSIGLKQEETAIALLDHALKAYSNAEIYAPEKSRALFMRSQVLRVMGQKAEAREELLEAARLYSETTGTETREPESLNKEDFESIISFWSR